MAAWFGGRVFCCFAGIEIAIVWFAADAARMAHLPNPTIHYWSILGRVLIYTVVAVLLALLRERRDELELAVQRKTARLQQEIAERARVEREILQISNREQQRFAYDLHDGLGNARRGNAENQAASGKVEWSRDFTKSRCHYWVNKGGDASPPHQDADVAATRWEV